MSKNGICKQRSHLVFFKIKTKQTQNICLLKKKDQINTRKHLPSQYYHSRHLTFSIEKKYLLFSAFKLDLDVFGMCFVDYFWKTEKNVCFAPVLRGFFSSNNKVMLWNYCKIFLRVNTLIVERRSGETEELFWLFFSSSFFFVV